MKIIIVAVLLSVLTACVTTSRMALETAYIDAVMRTGTPVEQIESVDLSDVELQKVTHAVNVYNKFRGKWKSVLSDIPSNIHLLAGGQLLTDYTELRYQFLLVKQVVVINWDKYDEFTQWQLEEYLAHAESLHKSVTDLLAAEKKHEALVNMLKVGGMLAGVAVQL